MPKYGAALAICCHLQTSDLANLIDMHLGYQALEQIVHEGRRQQRIIDFFI